MSRRIQGHSALGAAQILFGLFPVIGTLAFDGVDPLGVGTWRIGLGALVLGAVAVAVCGRAVVPRLEDVPRVLACALLGVALNQGLFLTGLSLSSPMNAGLVLCLTPVFTYGFAVLLRQERLVPKRAAGIVLALLGVLPLVFPGGVGGLGEHGLGNLLMVGNAASYSLYLVLGRPLVQRYPPLAVTAWAYIGSLAALPFFARGSDLVPETSTAWAALAYVVIGPTIVGYLLNLYGLARVRASTTAVWVYTQPLISGLGAWVVFREEPGVAMALAAVGLFVGIGLVAQSGTTAESSGQSDSA